MVAHEKKVESAPDSLKSKFASKSKGKSDYLAEMFPYPTGCLRTIGADLGAERRRKQSLTPEELQDFRVPAAVLMSSSLLLMPVRAQLRPRILEAVGVDVAGKDPRVDWGTFVRLSKVLTPGGVKRSTAIDFLARLFDPRLTGVVSGAEFELQIDELLGTSGITGADGETDPQTSAAAEGE